MPSMCVTVLVKHLVFVDNIRSHTSMLLQCICTTV